MAEELLSDAEHCVGEWVALCERGDHTAADALLLAGLIKFPRQARRFEAALKTLRTKGITRDDELRAWRLHNKVHPTRPAFWRAIPILLCDGGQASQCVGAISAAVQYLPPTEISQVAIKCAVHVMKLGHIAIVSDIVPFVSVDHISTVEHALALSAICARLSDKDGQRAALRRALQIDPGDRSIVLRFICLFESPAEYTLRDAIAANMQSFGVSVPARYLRNLSTALLRYGYADNAINLLEEAVRLSSSNLKCREALAKVYDKTGRRQEALTHWSVICESSNSVRAWKRVVELSVLTRGYREALVVSTMAMTRASFDVVLQPLHYAILKHLIEECNSSQERIDAENKRDMFLEAIWQRGVVGDGMVSSVVEMLCVTDRAPDAGKLLCQRIRVGRGNPLRRLELAKFFFRQGGVANALRQCQKAVALDPLFVPARLLLSQYLILTGSPAEATRQLMELPEPRPSEVRRLLARALAETEQQISSSRRWLAAKRRGKKRTTILLELLSKDDVGACMEGLRELGEAGEEFLVNNMQKVYGYAHPPLDVKRRAAIRQVARRRNSAEAALRRLRWSMPSAVGENSRASVARILRRWPFNPEVAMAAHATLASSAAALVTGDAKELFDIRARCRGALLCDGPVQLQSEYFAALKMHPIGQVFSEVYERRRRGVGKRRLVAAVCVSGEIRDMSESWATIRDKVIRPLGAHVFVHTWNKKGSPISGRMIHNEGDVRHFLRCLPYEILTPRRFGQAFPSVEKIFRVSPAIDSEYVIKEWGATAAIVEDSSALGRLLYNRPSMGGFSAMTYGICAAESLMRRFADENDIDYEIVIRIRPDLILEAIDLSTLVGAASEPGNLVTPPFPPARGVNDQFAAGTPAVMQLYAAAWHCLQANAKCPWIPGQSADTPEGLLYGHVFLSGLEVVASAHIRSHLSRYNWEIDCVLEAITCDLDSMTEALRAAVLEGLGSWLFHAKRRREVDGEGGGWQLSESVMNLVRRYPQLSDRVSI